LHASGVIIDDSHNTGDSIFRSLADAKAGAASKVRVTQQRAGKK
jgi:hypothetical protein